MAFDAFGGGVMPVNNNQHYPKTKQITLKKNSIFKPETVQDGFYLKLINDTIVNLPIETNLTINGNIWNFSQNPNPNQNNNPGNIINNITVELPINTIYCVTDVAKDPLGIARKTDVLQKFTFNQGTIITLPINTDLISQQDRTFEITLKKEKGVTV